MKRAVLTALGLCAVMLAGPAQGAVIVNETLFNAASNTGGDDPAGLSINFTSTTLFNGAEDIRSAFGKNGVGVNPGRVLFQDAQTADNGNFTMGDGGERVDFIQWQTTSTVNLAGYRIHIIGDGVVQGANRSAQLVRFSVDGVVKDFFDLDGVGTAVTREFAGGVAPGTTFRVEFTRSTTSGPRFAEIDAALIPEPSAALLGGLGLLLLLRRRRA